MNDGLLLSSILGHHPLLPDIIWIDLARSGGGIYSSFGVENAVFVGLEKHHESNAEHAAGSNPVRVKRT